MGEIIFFWSLWPNYLAVSLFPIDSLDELLISIGPLFQLHYSFKFGKSLLVGCREM